MNVNISLESQKWRFSKLTVAVASFNSMLGCIAHEDRFLCAVCSTCGSSFSFRLSGPKRFKTMFLRYLYINPCKEPTFCRPKIAVKVSGYQLWNNLPSCWKMKWLSSGSVDTMTGRPTRLVRNTGPYLTKWQQPYYVKLSSQKKYINIYFFQIEKLEADLPSHSFFDERRNVRWRVGRKELKCLSKKWQAHWTWREPSIASRIPPSVNPMSDEYDEEGSSA